MLTLNGRPVGGVRMTTQRLTVQEAAEILDTSVDAVRMRVRRGSLASEKDPDGRVYVWVDGDASETKPRLDGESDALISAKDETIATLQEQLAAERQAHAEARRIIAGLVERIPALDAPSDAPGGQERADSPGPRERPFTDEERAQEASQPRPWWRRVFGS
jgi:hypothetical protein